MTHSSGMSNAAQLIDDSMPAQDQTEISIFGPGWGECLVIHIGSNRWYIVDCCRCPVSKRPIALQYLESLGLDPAACVEGIIITHWHADHIAGAFDLVVACTSAKIFISSTLRNDHL